MNNAFPETGTLANLLLRYLAEEKVEYIFGIPGGPLMPLYEALFKFDRIKPIIAKHEEGAAFMADGYARATGRLGVCCATTGPGSTNLLTGVACAYADSVPLLVITAQVATSVFGKGAAQESTYYGVDIVDMFKPVTKFSAMVHSAEHGDSLFRSALRTALSGRRGPVHINIPADYMKKEVPQIVVAPENYRIESRQFAREAIKQAAHLLLHAANPVIIAGNGVNVSAGNDELRQLAEKLCIPVATSPKGKGAFPENHILSLGVLGFAGSSLADKYLLSGKADVVLAAGTSLGELPSANWDARLSPSKALIHIDIDPEEIGKNYAVTTGIVGDAKAVLKELNYQIDRELKWLTPPAKNGLASIRTLKTIIESEANAAAENAGLDSIPIKQPRILAELRKALPSDAILFIDIGTCMPWAINCFPVYEPRTFFVNLGFGSMGYAMAAGIGAKLGMPNKNVFVLAGDGAFAMNGFEIHTAVEMNIPVVWIIINNSGLGMIHQGEQMQFKGQFCTSKYQNSLKVTEIAKGLGADAIKISDPRDLSGAFATAVKATRPTVIEVMTSIEELAPMGRRMESLDTMFIKESKNAFPATRDN